MCAKVTEGARAARPASKRTEFLVALGRDTMCSALSGGSAEIIFMILGKIRDPQTKVRTAMAHRPFKTDMGGIPQEGW